MRERKLLLFARTRMVLITLGRALRDEGYVVLPSRFEELGVDGLVRVEPDLALIPVGHEAMRSPEFRALADAMGVRVLLFTGDEETEADGAALPSDPQPPYPVLEYAGDCRELAALLRHTIEEPAIDDGAD